MGEIPSKYYIEDPELLGLLIFGIVLSWFAFGLVLYLHQESEREREKINSDEERGAKERGPE